jgi:hypothetical protein
MLSASHFVTGPGRRCAGADHVMRDVGSLKRMYRTCVMSHRLYYRPAERDRAMQKQKQTQKQQPPDAASHVRGVYMDADGRAYKGACVRMHDELYFVFRGANGLGDILDALIDAQPVALGSDAHGAARVHRGFLRHYQAMRTPLVEDAGACLAEGGVSRVVFAGHSMGGAIAMMAAVDVAAEVPKMRARPLQIECHTFGTPCTGNAEFLELLPERTMMVRHAADVVPLVHLHKDFRQLEGCILNTPAHRGPSSSSSAVSGASLDSYDCGHTAFDPVRAARDLGIRKLVEFHSCLTYSDGLRQIIRTEEGERE